MTKIIIAELTSTQRIVLEPQVSINSQDRIELKKEWRKTSESDWVSSKGITIPIQYIGVLIKSLQELPPSDL